MKHRQFSGVMLVVLFSVVSVASGEVNEIILRVNERIATTFDYESERIERFQAIQQAESLTEERRQELLASLGETVMKDIFEQLLMLSRADQLKLQVTPSEMDDALQRTKQNFGIRSEAEYRAALESANLTEERLRTRLERSLLVQKVMGQEVYSRVRLEEEDLRRYYQSHAEDFQVPQRLNLREVVVLEASGLQGEDLALLAEEIRQQLSTGRDIEEVVEPYREEGVSTGVVDLGWVEVGDLNKDLEEAVWGLQAGEVSPAVEARGGLHIVVVAEREEARLLEFAEVQEQIRTIEQGRLMEDEMAKYIEELKKSSYIVANPPPEAAGFRAALASSLPSELDAYRDIEPGLGDALPLELPPSPPSEGSEESGDDSVEGPPPEEG